MTDNPFFHTVEPFEARLKTGNQDDGIMATYDGEPPVLSTPNITVNLDSVCPNANIRTRKRYFEVLEEERLTLEKENEQKKEEEEKQQKFIMLETKRIKAEIEAEVEQKNKSYFRKAVDWWYSK